MTNDHGDTEPAGLEIVARSLGPRGTSSGNGSAGFDADIINGTPVSPADRAAHAAPPPPQAERHVPPGVLECMRKQVGDFADFAHRSRIAPDGDALHALGYGGGITAKAVEKIADKLNGTVAGPDSDRRALNNSLLLALVAPGDPDELTERQRELFVSWRGHLALDVSMAEIGGEPETVVIPLDDHPERQLAAGDGQVIKASGRPLSVPYAAVIVGSAAYIAGERPYLSLESLMAYARSKVYRSHGVGLQAARNLEIVVLLDGWLEGGLWIDIDRTTGRAAAALAIGLSPTGVRFTHVPRLRSPELRTDKLGTQSAGVATA